MLDSLFKKLSLTNVHKQNLNYNSFSAKLTSCQLILNVNCVSVNIIPPPPHTKVAILQN